MREIERRLARSSFGTTAARKARKSVPESTAARIVAKSKTVRLTVAKGEKPGDRI